MTAKPRSYMKGHALSARVAATTGLAFADLWKYVQIHIYDGEPAESKPWRLCLVPEGTAALRNVPLEARPLLTIWALERWLAEEHRDGPVALAARRAVDAEHFEALARSYLPFAANGKPKGSRGVVRKAIDRVLVDHPSLKPADLWQWFKDGKVDKWSVDHDDSQIWPPASGKKNPGKNDGAPRAKHTFMNIATKALEDLEARK